MTTSGKRLARWEIILMAMIMSVTLNLGLALLLVGLPNKANATTTKSHPPVEYIGQSGDGTWWSTEVTTVNGPLECMRETGNNSGNDAISCNWEKFNEEQSHK